MFAVDDEARHSPPTFRWSDCDPKDRPENRYLVDRMIPERGCHLIIGPPKSGKSQLLAHIVACILSGKPVFGHYAVLFAKGEPFRILYILTEENRYRIRERVEQNLLGFGLSDDEIAELGQQFEDRIWISSRDKSADRDLADTIFSVEVHKPWFLQVMAEREYGVGIVDSLRPAHNFEENSSTAMKPVTDMMREVSDYGCALVIHHSGHANPEFTRLGGDAGRGSSDLDAARDTAIHIQKGKFGGKMLIGFFHRDDADRYVALKTEVDRERNMVRWTWIAETEDPGLANRLLEKAEMFERMDAAKVPEELPRLSDMKGVFGNNYSAHIGSMEQDGLIESCKLTTGRPGQNPTMLMRPGQFTDAEWAEAEQRMREES
jgi:KaiC/GvpD/RAD55 family RecA-like ATPase